MADANNVWSRKGVFATALLTVSAACGDGTSPDSLSIDPTVNAPLPTLVRELAIPPRFGVHDTFIRDGILFVCAWNTGLILYDAGNGIRGGTPANPVEISRVVTSDNGVPGGPAVHNAWWFHNPVAGEKRYVFVGQEGPASIGVTSTGDIHVVDVSDLTQPREVAFYHMNVTPAAGTHNFWMDEAAQVLYAAYYNGGIVALDVSGTLAGDLAAREIARIKPANTTFMWGVQLSGGSVYATDILNGFYQLRLTNGTLTTAAGGGNVNDRYSSDLWVTGQYAYTGTYGGGGGRGGVRGNAVKLWRLDASGAPSLADSVIIGGISNVSDVKGSDDGRLLAVSAEGGSGAGLYLFSLADPARPSLVGRALVGAGVHTVKVADIGGRRYAFAARNPGGPGPALLIYDVTTLSP